MKTITSLIIATIICGITACSPRSDYEIEQAELKKEQQELMKEEAELRKEYERLRQEYLREKNEFRRTVAQENKTGHKEPRQLTRSELDTLTNKVRSYALWPTANVMK